MDYREKSEIRDGMRIDWDMPIKMDDGLVLRCDIYRPVADGKYPVIMTLGPYGKWLHFEDLYKTQWDRMCASSGRAYRFDQQVSMLGGCRPGEMGS
jgi:predicted acyl esterase